jgi:glutathione-independent formaldehyde dehydrogenase
MNEMRAVVWKEPYKVAVENIDAPRIEEPTDAILRLTTAAICGSDLHMYEGRAPVEAGEVFGHENLGVIEQVGPGVRTIKPGDRVVLPFNIGCGFCFNCTRGYGNACLTTNPQSHGGGYGYSGMGPHRGGQAEMVRVPYADFNCLKLPGTPGDRFEDDFVLLADIFPTGYHATEQAKVRPGDTVAIFGAGPVGLMAALSATIRGASEIYVVDTVPERLQKVRELGAIPIDFAKGDPVEQIFALRKPHRDQVQGLRPQAGEKMPGVMCGIDAVGYEAWAHDAPGRRQSPAQVIEDVIRVTNPTGNVGLIGVYFPKDPRGVDENEKQGKFTISLGQAWEKGLSIEMGQAPVKRYNEYLRDLIVAGIAKPSFLVSHRLPLEAAPDAYHKFDERIEGYTKILLKPQQHVMN